MLFNDLQDSPAFRSKCQQLLHADEKFFKQRFTVLQRGTRKYISALESGYQSTLEFVEALDTFCGASDNNSDIDSFAYGGPTLARFALAFKELASFQELLRTQIEIIVADRLNHTVTQLVTDAKAASKTLEQRSQTYDASRKKVLGHGSSISMRLSMPGKNSSSEKDLTVAKTAYEEARYDLARKLTLFDAHCRFEFLEAISSVTDAHTKYFSHCVNTFGGISDYVQQSLQWADALRDEAGAAEAALEKAIAVQLVQDGVDQSKESGDTPTAAVPSPSFSGGPLQMSAAATAMTGDIETRIQNTHLSSGTQVTVLKQGYLLKQSSKSKSKWQRRFFILDSKGHLYYYSSKGTDKSNSGRGTPHDTVNLLTSAVKPYTAPEDQPLPFAFSIVSPGREYLLQAESEAEAQEWMSTLQATISSLLNRQIDPHSIQPHRVASPNKLPKFRSNSRSSDSKDDSNLVGPLEIGILRSASSMSEAAPQNSSCPSKRSTEGEATPQSKPQPQPQSSIVSTVQAAAPGNDRCADCGADNPEWASLNLGDLVCIECSGVHRSMGVHCSKVRSLTLDVRVWDSSILALFKSLGNDFANGVYEANLGVNADLTSDSDTDDDVEKKPAPNAPAAEKALYIKKKYGDKKFVAVPLDHTGAPDVLISQELLWDACDAGHVQQAYTAIAWGSDVGHRYTSASAAQLVFEANVRAGGSNDAVVSPTSLGDVTALHAACRKGSMETVELLLQTTGCNIEARDGFGRTPLAYAVLYSRHEVAKLLLKRGAIDGRDGTGHTCLQLLQNQSNSSQDFELAALLSKASS